MTDVRSAWSETGEQLTALGSKLGAHFSRHRDPDGEKARAETDEALKRLTDAVKDAFDSVGAAARDEAVQQDVKQVGRSLISALDVTFREVSDEVRKAFDRPSPGADTAGRSYPSTGETPGGEPDINTAGDKPVTGPQDPPPTP